MDSRPWGFLFFFLFFAGYSLGCSKSAPPEGMVLIPAGPFIMGSNKMDAEGLGRQMGMIRPLYENEHPERKPYLPDYYIDRVEVSNARYRFFTDEKGHRLPPLWDNGVIPLGKEDHPVAFVSWFDARTFCRWAGGRLPSEMEWEKAARGPEGLVFPWGNTFEEGRAHTGGGDIDDTRPVGTMENGNSIYGISDLVGNVAEWVEDWYEAYSGNVKPSPLYGKKLKVLRGGSWGGGGGHYTVSVFYRLPHRLFADPLDRFPDTGFRCVKEK